MSRLFDVLYVASLSVLFFAVFGRAVSSSPYTYDEADYMAATRLGWGGNYLDANAMSLPEFAETGWKAAHHEISRTQLSEYVRARRDPLFLRHYHGPLNEYFVLAANAIGGSGERWMRLANYIFYVLTFATIYFGILWVFGAEFRIAAVLASLSYLFCLNNALSLSWLSSHAPYAWLSILTLFGIAKFISAPTRRHFYLALVLCVLSFCAVEYAGLLFIALAAAILTVRRKFFEGWTGGDYWRVARNSVLLTIGLLLILWPSSILKFTIVQGVAYTVFMVRRGSYSVSTPWEVWRARFDAIPLDMALLCFSVLVSAVFVWRSPRRNLLMPFLLYGLLLGLTTLKNTNDSARYISSLFAPFYVAGAVLIGGWLKRRAVALQAAAAAALFAGLLVVAQRAVAAHETPDTNGELPRAVAWMRRHPTAPVLVPFEVMPTLRYYFPEANIKDYTPGATPEQIAAAARADAGVCADKVMLPFLRDTFPNATVTEAGSLGCLDK